RFLKQSDQTQSGDVGLAEFIHYVREHEKNLRLQFTHLDKNRDGKVDLEEMIEAFKELGIDMDRVEAAKLLKRMDKDGSLNISYDEWRDFLLLAPSADIHELVKYWRHSTNLRYNQEYLAMIGREVPPKSLSPIEPPSSQTFPPTTNIESAPTVVSQTTTPTNTTAALKTRTTTINEPLLGPLVETNDDLDLDLEAQELSLLSLFDLEQAIEHVTELILNPSLFGGGGDSGSSASSIAAGVHQHRGHHHNTHLLVDGKVQWNSDFLLTSSSSFVLPARARATAVFLCFWFTFWILWT
ncbi:hypothetical protein pipiens_016771, partial [Culex pipiens pipiens]